MDDKTFFKYFVNYEQFTAMLCEYSFGEIIVEIAQLLKITAAQLEQYPLQELLHVSQTVMYQDVLHELLDNQSRYDWIYRRLADAVSRELLFELLCFRVLPAAKYLEGKIPDSRQQTECINIDGFERLEHVEQTQERSHASTVLKNKDYIKHEFPHIRVCVNPVFSDLWEIPKLLDYMHAGYQFYVRRETKGSKMEIALYAAPAKQAPQTVKQAPKTTKPAGGKRVVAMAPYDRPWNNVELIKDCGLIPYLLYKRHGCDVRMVGAKGEGYTYHTLIDGVTLEFLEDGSIESKVHYIKNHAKQIDLLILRGPYEDNRALAPIYKWNNPDGKIFVGLDANSAWMDRMEWEHPHFQLFMDSCDVIATSGAATARYLNEKWPWKIEHIPNGFYDFERKNRMPSFENKQNIILTVGRLGTTQKATHVLLESFAKIADFLPEWKLRLVGSVEPTFQDYIAQFREQYPKLQEKIEWVGTIEDRAQLFEEYRKAKIFALTSDVEGGTPNVVAEALYHGCVVATTRIDACEEATDGGRCGVIADRDDVDGFAHQLLELAKDEKLEELSVAAYRYGRRHFDMCSITDNVYELAFGENNG